MGLSSTAVLGQLTTRKNAIGFRLTQLSNDKVSLSREMQKVSRKYQSALNQKVLKWSNNSGVTYMDLSYSNLMRPSPMNQNKPYLLTDMNDRVVIDSDYKKYAEMISANGAAGGNWESVRTQVLSGLTGIDAEKINNTYSSQENIAKYELVLNNLIEEEPQKPTKKTNAQSFISNLGSSTGISNGFTDGSDWADAYSKGGDIKLGNSTEAAANLKSITEHIATTLGKYVDDPDKLKTACETFYTAQLGILNDPESEKNKQSLESDQTVLSGNKNDITVDVTQMINEILSSYEDISDNCINGGYNNQTMYVWNDIDSPTYTSWKEKHDEWQVKYDAAKADYDNAVSTKNQLFTSEGESIIDFYDTIFSAIAEKGWVENNQVNDPDYLNEMLQNNLYTLTTVERDAEYKVTSGEGKTSCDDITGEYVWDNDYSTDIASNFTNIFFVKDSDAAEEALVEYEHEKSIINQKETRIDNEMNNLETEQAAVNQMIQSVQKVINDNIERTMDTMG